MSAVMWLATTDASGDVDVPGSLAAALDEHVSRYCSADGPLFPGPCGGRLTHSGMFQGW